VGCNFFAGDKVTTAAQARAVFFLFRRAEVGL
jgi:hypothetical protein